METVDIIVNQEPVDVTFECPHCEGEININYSDFCGLAGEPCDWRFSKIICPKCKKDIEIGSADWC